MVTIVSPIPTYYGKYLGSEYVERTDLYDNRGISLPAYVTGHTEQLAES